MMLSKTKTRSGARTRGECIKIDGLLVRKLSAREVEQFKQAVRSTHSAYGRQYLLEAAP